MDSEHICNHNDCFISAFRGLRNGIYYGGKIRFVHALVMAILFKEGTLYSKLTSIIKPTYEHAKNLGLFAFIYKLTVCALKHLFKTRSKLVNFVAGIVGSFFTWKNKSAVNMQIMLYLLSRNILAITNIVSDKFNIKFDGFPYASMLVWGLVMFLFEYRPHALQNSLTSSMNFIYKDSDKYHGWRDLVPFHIPF